MPNIIKATVNVIEDASKPNGYRFETTDLPMGPENFLYFRNCTKEDRFHIYYKLEGFSGYSFPDPSDNNDKPLWVAHGNNASCPRQASSWGQFVAIDREDYDRTLIVENKNETPIKFFYTLRIRNGGNVIELDPGGSNENGGHSKSSYSLLTYAGVAVAAGIVSAAVTTAAVWRLWLN